MQNLPFSARVKCSGAPDIILTEGLQDHFKCDTALAACGINFTLAGQGIDSENQASYKSFTEFLGGGRMA